MDPLVTMVSGVPEVSTVGVNPLQETCSTWLDRFWVCATVTLPSAPSSQVFGSHTLGPGLVTADEVAAAACDDVPRPMGATPSATTTDQTRATAGNLRRHPPRLVPGSSRSLMTGTSVRTRTAVTRREVDQAASRPHGSGSHPFGQPYMAGSGRTDVRDHNATTL